MDAQTAPDNWRHSRQSRILVLVQSIVGMLLVFTATSRYGAGTSPDSVAYLSTARNLVTGQGYTTYNGNPFVIFPPLFPTLLAGIGLAGIDPLDSARFVNAISFGLVIFASGYWLLKHTRSKVIALLGTAAVLLSMPLIEVSVYAWSEPVFILLTLLFLLEIEEFLKNGKHLVLVLSAMLAAFATLERYIGVTVIVTGLFVLILQRKTTLSKRFVNATAFGLISSLPIGVWVARNVLVSSTLTGARMSTPYTPIQHLYNALDAVSTWFLPSSSLFDASRLSRFPESLRSILQTVMLPPVPRFIVSILLISTIIGSLVLIIRRNPNHGRSVFLPLAMPMLCFLVVYPSIFILTSMIYSAREPINSRYMSPIYIPLIAFVALVVDLGVDFASKHTRNRTPIRLLFVLFGIWLLYPLSFGIGKVIYLAKDGAGEYSSSLWRNSSLMMYLKQHPLSGQVYSNSPNALYIDNGMSASLSPRKYTYQTHDAITEDLVLFRASLSSSEDIYLAWFNIEDSSYLYNPNELGSIFDIQVVATTPDGAIYRFKP